MGKNSITQHLRLCLLLGSVLLLGACSSIRLAYDNAETLAMLWADRYVDFSRDQETLIRPRLRALLAWHRGTQLVEVQNLLTRIAVRIDPYTGMRTPVTVAEVRSLEQEARALTLVIEARARPDLAELALTLSPAQIDRIDGKLADNIEKYRKEAIGNDPGMRRRAERAIERAEDWLGRLNRAQRDQVRALAEQVLAPHAVVLEQAQQRRRALIEVLRRIQREQPAREQAGLWLRTYAEMMVGQGTPEERDRATRIGEGSAALNAAIINLASVEQRARATQRLQDWVSTFQTLAQPAPR